MKSKKENEVIYVDRTNTLYQDNGELFIYTDDYEIVWNCDSLFNDLPHIIHMVLKSKEYTDKRIKENIIGVIENFGK